MKLFRTELDQGLSKKLFEIDTNQFIADNLNFYEDKIECDLSAEKNANGYHIIGTLKIPFEQICDRCLKIYNDLKIVGINFWITDLEEMLQDNSDDILYIANNETEIDITMLLRDNILLEKQMKCICSKDCKGLCINCGTNLNDSDCSCSMNSENNPWAELNKLTG